MSDWFSGLGDDFSSFFGGVGNAASSAGNAIASGAGDVANFFTNDVPSALGFGSSPTTALANNVNGATPTIAPTVASGAQPATGGITSAAGGTDLALPPGTTALAAPDGSGDPNSTPVPGATGGKAPQGTMQQIMSTLGLGNASTGDLLKGAIGAGGLGYAVANNMGSTENEKALKGQAQNQAAQGQQLESYLSNGTLPPGAQAYVDQQTAAQKAAIRSEYAANGMSGTTAETQELNNVDTQATTQMFQIASSLYQSGVTETGASSQLYNLLMNADSANNAQVGSAISNFVSALGGGAPATQKGTISFG